MTIYLKNVPQEAASRAAGAPFVVFGLLQHEHKKTVLNFTVQRNTEYDGSVRSKVTLLPPYRAQSVLTNEPLGPSDPVRRPTAITGEPDL